MSYNFSDVHEIQKLYETARTVVPTTKYYTMAAGKEILAVLQSAASLIPVPFLQEAIGVALKVIEVCEVHRIPPLNSARWMIKIFARGRRLLEKRSKICKLRSAITSHNAQ